MRALGLTVCLTVAACGDSAKPGSTCTRACPPPGWTTLDLLAGVPGGPGWVDGTLVAAHFSDPWTLASDGQGHLYVADAETIRVIDLAADSVATLAGVFNQVGGTDGVGAAATFNTPSGLAYANGQLYVADTENDVIRKIDVATATVTTVAGAFQQPGAVDGSGVAASFAELEGLALDGNGNLYVADTDNDEIRVLSLNDGAVTTVAGAARTIGATDGVGADALFNKPRALAIDAAGNLYVADSLNLSVRRVQVATRTVSTLATFDTPPQGLAIDGSDVLVSLADHRLVRVTAGGAVVAVAGAAGAAGFVDGAGVDARFNSPAGMLNDGSGTVYIADEHNAVIRTIALAGATVRTYAGARSSGSSDGTGTQARFAAPEGLAADANAAYVSDTGNSVVRKIALATGEVTTLAGMAGQKGTADGPRGDARFDQPEGLALDATAGQLYVADSQNRNIRRIDLATGAVSTISYSFVPGDPFGGFQTPSGLALDRGHLYVTDYGNHVVIAIDLKKAQLSTLAGNALAPGRADGIGTGAGFYSPLGIAADGRGHLYVADNLNHAIRKIDVASATVSTLAGEPQIQGSSDGVGPTAHFRYPSGVAADSLGNVFVSDSNNAVRRIDASNGTVTTVVGNLSAAGVRLGPLPAQLTQPSALALTPLGSLLVVSENAVLLAH